MSDRVKELIEARDATALDALRKAHSNYPAALCRTLVQS